MHCFLLIPPPTESLGGVVLNECLSIVKVASGFGKGILAQDAHYFKFWEYSSKLLSTMGISKSRGIPKFGWFIRENLIKMDDLEVTLFLETPIFIFVRIIGPCNRGA